MSIIDILWLQRRNHRKSDFFTYFTFFLSPKIINFGSRWLQKRVFLELLLSEMLESMAKFSSCEYYRYPMATTGEIIENLIFWHISHFFQVQKSSILAPNGSKNAFFWNYNSQRCWKVWQSLVPVSIIDILWLQRRNHRKSDFFTYFTFFLSPKIINFGSRWLQKRVFWSYNSQRCCKMWQSLVHVSIIDIIWRQREKSSKIWFFWHLSLFF